MLFLHSTRQFAGLNSLDLAKWIKGRPKNKNAALEGIAALRHAASNSDWNYTGKLRLLEAEHAAAEWNSFEDTRQVLATYNASIASAKHSRFIHEQGLACEKAGFYCKKAGDVKNALIYFNQARQCYSEWGSSVKVDFIQNELNSL
jgi:hypothetical protein